jgi:hypothetical protein
VKETAVFRTPCELDGLVRDHAARLAADRRAVSPVGTAPPARRGALRQTIGMILIRAGERLADRGAVSGRRLPRPAVAGRVRS